MAENSFEPQSMARDRTTWPKSKGITVPTSGMSGRTLEGHPEESTSQLADYSQDAMPGDDYLNHHSPPSAQNNLWDNHTTLSVKCYNGANPTAPVVSSGFDQSMPQQTGATAVATLGVSNTNAGDFHKTQETTTTRKNALGNLSYADLITKAIESSPDQRLTLSQIYEWMMKNIPYFRDKGDSNSSAGLKNSIRHNLSLHAKFKRVQNEETGKSSWWVVNYDAKQEKAPRGWAVSVDAVNAKSMAAMKDAAKRKQANLLKKQHSSRTQESNTSFFSGMVSSLPKNMGNEFRDRSGFHASSIVGSYPARDLDDGGGFVPTVGSYTGLSNLGSLPSAGNLLDMSRNRNSPTSSMLENFEQLRLSAGPSGYRQLGQGKPQQAENPPGYLMSMGENVTYSGDFNDIDPNGLFDPGEFDNSTVMSDISGTIMDVEPD